MVLLLEQEPVRIERILQQRGYGHRRADAENDVGRTGKGARIANTCQGRDKSRGAAGWTYPIEASG